jgi:hypothetical protein
MSCVAGGITTWVQSQGGLQPDGGAGKRELFKRCRAKLVPLDPTIRRWVKAD